MKLISASYLVKLFALISAAGLFFYILTENSVEVPKSAVKVHLDNVKYILDLKESSTYQFKYLDHVRSAFRQVYCPAYPNCIVTEDRELLSDIEDFDAILFHGFRLPFMSSNQLPQSRSQKQKYIFATTESAKDNPICNPQFDGYFNWTWTYRLDSDLLWSYIVVQDMQGRKIAPKVNTTWLSYNQRINKKLRTKLKSKSKAAAWFVSHCSTSGRREQFVEEVSRELQPYNLTVDIYGECGKKTQCPKQYENCNQMIEKDYYFYFAFEKSFDKDYVSEKVLTAYNNLAVPVVYGGADYSRFLPPGSYLDGYKLGAKYLAMTMSSIIRDRSRYEDMFQWSSFYRIKEPFLIEMCNLCAKLSSPRKVTMWNHFRQWWNRDMSSCESETLYSRYDDNMKMDVMSTAPASN